MTLFGIGGRRGIPAPLGNPSQQSVGNSSTASTTAQPHSILGPSAITLAKNPATIVTTRTLPPSVTLPRITSPAARLPPTVGFLPPLIIPPKKKYEVDTLRLSQFKFVDDKFQPVEKNGISVFRPEIVSVYDFQPVDGYSKLGDKNAAESAEQLIKAQYQASEIRGLTISKLIQDMRTRREYKVPLDNIKKEFVNKLASTRLALGYFSGIITKVEEVQRSIDPKKIPETSYDLSNFLSLRTFFERRMQYPRTRFAKFSDTKILNQLTSDLKNILETYSYSLLDIVDSDRNSDISPVRIDKTYTKSNGFTFSMDSIRSSDRGNLLTFKPAEFTQILNSFPSTADDRIKLLSVLLSKELRVSRQLGNVQTARILREKYAQGSTSNPFDNICGVVGDTIFDVPSGPNSLASLTFGQTEIENIIILPFESVYVDAENETKTYVPGSSYFGDNILNITPGGFNTEPFTSFASKYNDVFSDAKNTIETLLELSLTDPSPLSPDFVLDKFLLSSVEATSGLASSAGMDRTQAITAALFKLANTDSVLKNMLFEYVLLLGLMANSSLDQKKIFDRLASEVVTIQNFTFSKISSTDNPNLRGGIGTLRPYVENLARQIEDKVFELVYPQIYRRLNRNIARLVPTVGVDLTSTVESGPVRGLSASARRLIGTAARSVSVSSDGGYLLTFTNGEIKETLINTATATGPASTNLCKEFIDLCVKFDQLASVNGNPNYLITDATSRTRQNFWSVSTQMLIIFEILSSVSQKFTFSSFNRGTGLSNGTITVNTSLTNSINKIIRSVIPVVSADVAKTIYETNGTALGRLGTFSVRSRDTSRESTSRPGNAGIPSFGSVSIPNPSFDLRIPALTSLFTKGLDQKLNSPLYGFGKLDFDVSDLLANSPLILEYKKNLVALRKKLRDEDKIVMNVLHIFNVINKQLMSAKESVSRAFTAESLNTFLSATGLTIQDMELVKIPSQLRTSLWLYDLYDERLSDATSVVDTEESGLGFIITDRTPLSHLSGMFSMLNQPEYSRKGLAGKRIKLVTVGVPAGFSRNLSDRVKRENISETNFADKQFDVISVHVYKRDARFDDIVFKPQKFIFDLSLFPIKNFLPASAERARIDYVRLIREARFRDYESPSAKKEINLSKITTDEKYSFLSLEQKTQMIKNHLESQLFEIYIKLICGAKINEETFSNTDYQKLSSMDQVVSALILSFLKNVRGKTIPNQSFSSLLVNPNVDQETKDIIRLLSYGNLMFQGDFIKNRILNTKLFDRVFHIPVNMEKFEIDVEKTTETSSGRMAYNKNSFQNMIERREGKEFLVTKNQNQAMFEDIFIVLETNLRNGR